MQSAKNEGLHFSVSDKRSKVSVKRGNESTATDTVLKLWWMRLFRYSLFSTRNIAEACKQLDCKMIYISTDYVFDGQGNKPWQADCKDFAPLNYYGQTKLEGAGAVLRAARVRFHERRECGSNSVQLRFSERDTQAYCFSGSPLGIY